MSVHRPTSAFVARHGTFSAQDAEGSTAPDCHWPAAARQPCEVGEDPELPDGAKERLDRLLLGKAGLRGGGGGYVGNERMPEGGCRCGICVYCLVSQNWSIWVGNDTQW